VINDGAMVRGVSLKSDNRNHNYGNNYAPAAEEGESGKSLEGYLNSTLFLHELPLLSADHASSPPLPLFDRILFLRGSLFEEDIKSAASSASASR